MFICLEGIKPLKYAGELGASLKRDIYENDIHLGGETGKTGKLFDGQSQLMRNIGQNVGGIKFTGGFKVMRKHIEKRI